LALSFDYGQRHAVELDAARAVAQQAGAIEHRIANVDLRAFGGSALTDHDVDVPKGRDVASMADAIPITYAPPRITIFLPLALASAAVRDAGDIFSGANAIDYSGYPDCRPEYLAAYEAMANLATKAAIEDGRRLTIHAPLLAMSKAEIIRKGAEL